MQPFKNEYTSEMNQQDRFALANKYSLNKENETARKKRLNTYRVHTEKKKEIEKETEKDKQQQ